MAQRPTREAGAPPSGSPTGSARRARRRPPPPVKKAFPWGVVATVIVLVVGLGGILTYAVSNQGSGFTDPLEAADKGVDGVKTYDGLKQDHKDGVLTYAQDPPSGGPHNSVWSTCEGNVYAAAVPKENATHSLEHGAVWLAYRPDLPKADIARLAGLVEGTSYRLMSPYPGLKDPVSLQAWGRQLKLSSVDTKRAEQFLQAYTNGPQAPEKGAPCSGGTPTTGVTPAGA